MREHLLITTAIGLMLGTAAFAQSPSEQPRTNSPAAAQSQTNPNSSAQSPGSAPSASSSTSTPSSTPSAQNAQSTPSATSKSPTTTSQSAPNASGSNEPARSQAQSNQAAPPSQAPSQAQSAQPSNSSNQAQTNTAPPTNNRSQASPANTNANTNAGAQPSANTAQPSTNTAAQPSTNTTAQPSNSQTNTAQSRASNVNVSASLNNSQRTRVSESIARLNVAPVNNVNFSLSVGTVVPRDVRFRPLPADVVEVMPQYRGYDFFVVRDDILIVEPSTYKIVDVLPRTGRSTGAAPASHRTTFSERDREVIRKHARSRTEQRTTGSVASTRVQIGDRLPDSVEVRSFPEEVYRESPRLREYRYIERDSRTYLIEPHERTIIEEIE